MTKCGNRAVTKLIIDFLNLLKTRPTGEAKHTNYETITVVIRK